MKAKVTSGTAKALVDGKPKKKAIAAALRKSGKARSKKRANTVMAGY